MIPDDVIDQVRDTADLVEVIGEAVQLKRTGSDYRGPCPFHGGTHRNFAVVPKKGLYYCYVCHEAGDIFTWHMKRHGLDYPSAVREVARRAGIVIPEEATRAETNRFEHLYAAVAVAQEFFARALREGDESKAAREYLERREIPQLLAAELGLGYAPRGKAFLEEAARLGIAEDTLLDAGLVARREDGTLSPRFRGRLLFPIHDLRGRVVAFGGRILGSGEPKYLNSPDSEIFHKGKQLYHLHVAKSAIRKEETVVLVEGYFDVLRLAHAGVEHVVAPLGTALTPDQAALLKRFAPLAIIFYDSDQAGLRATFRAGDELLRHGFTVRVATPPAGLDPDTLGQQGGRPALDAVLVDAVDIFERKIQLLDRKGWFADFEHRREAIDRLLPTVRATADPIARDLYIARLAERAGVTREVLEGELARAVSRGPAFSPRAAPVDSVARGASPERDAPSPRQPVGARTEEKLLAVLIHAPSWLARAREELVAGLFEVETYREIAEHLLGGPADRPAEQAEAALSPRAHEAWTRLGAAASRLEGMDLDSEYVGATDRLRHRAAYRELSAITDPAARGRRIQELRIPPEVYAAWRQKERLRRRPSPGMDRPT